MLLSFLWGKKCVQKRYREVGSSEWLLLCLELRKPSSISPHAVPICYCCEQTESVWVPCSLSLFPLGSLKGFLIETFNSKEEGGGFFPGDPFNVVLDSQLPRLLLLFLEITVLSSTAVNKSWC